LGIKYLNENDYLLIGVISIYETIGLKGGILTISEKIQAQVVYNEKIMLIQNNNNTKIG
jgi:hypothetical protein